MKVPLLDLKAQHAAIRGEVLAAVTEVLDSQVCIGGPKVAELENKIAEVSNCRFGVGVSSGTDAILCSLMSLGIGPNDEVITTPFTFFATVGAIVRTGATPIFVDIDPCTYNLNPDLIERAVTPRTKAILPVHLFGQMCDMDPIMEIATRYGLWVIEDAAQSVTATYKGRKAGSIGTVGCFSFFPSKNLGGAGDGGMIVTNDEALYQKMALLRNHGAKPKYFHKYVGGNFRLDPLQAAILLVKLPYLDSWSEARRRNAAYYTGRLQGDAIGTPFISPDCVSIYNQYVIRLQDRDRVMGHLKANGVGTEIYYPRPAHLQECFSQSGYSEGDLPCSEAAARESLAIPIYPELTPAMLEFTAKKVLEAVAPRLRRPHEDLSVYGARG
jgi:dTDP-4-amino-4,6-dideoxygalactose transaminase